MVETVGVLLMYYGTPSGLDDVERYYTDIRGGRAPSPEALAELRERYEAIGGDFPLERITRHQAEGLERALNEAPGDRTFRVYVGAKHSPPFVGGAVRAMAGDGVTRAVGLVLAPHFSKMSTGGYVERARDAMSETLEIDFVRSWFDNERFLDLLADRVVEAIERGLEPEDVHQTMYVFSAHSLPERILEWGDPYPEQLAQTAKLVAERVGLPDELFTTAWQSAGRTGEPWLGPDVTEVIEMAGLRGLHGVLVCPCGFTADHLEILYDLDIEARAAAERAGIKLVRTESMNADPEFIAVLADVVRWRLGVGQGVS